MKPTHTKELEEIAIEQRISDCTNAMIGVRNPQAFVEAAKKSLGVLKQAKKALDKSCWCGSYPPEWQGKCAACFAFTSCEQALTNFESALKGGQGE